MSDTQVIALISAVPASIPPTRKAFEAGFPDAVLWNLLDDRLLEDATEQGGLTSGLADRMQRLITHARTEGASGVLLTCSMYAPVAHAAAGLAGVPVLGPDDALFEAVRDAGPSRVLLVSSGAGPLADSVERLRAAVGDGSVIIGVLATGAATAARAGDLEGLTAAIVHAIEDVQEPFDAVALGQYSLAPAAASVAEQIGLPVLSGPELAVAKLRSMLAEGAP